MKCWAVVPAAGVGQRMGAVIPKQYLSFQGRTVIEHTLARLLAEPRIPRVAVALGSDDVWWSGLEVAGDPRVIRARGGRERCDSVRNGLEALVDVAGADLDDWVLVHDAARPCLRGEDLGGLIDALIHDPVGGVLACPVRDTMKRADASGRIARTEDREGLWHALTPQMFRLGALWDAIDDALADGFVVTDEAGAMEHAGYEPRLVEGRADNIKITRPEDLALAEFFLGNQGRLAADERR